jgi:nicotinate-nucleotide pyrophosphorylase (carboxylating)
VQAPATVDWLGLYLLEDLGPGDVTSETLLPHSEGRARVVARGRTLVAGARHAAELFRRLGAAATVQVADGAWAEPGATVLAVQGPARAILAGERTALNLLARMGGIATATRALADQGVRVAGTRKTTPGFRAFEKEAIAIGGGDPHRMGLWDAAMVKDNHLAAVGGDVAAAVRLLRERHPGLVVECEVERREDALAAAAAGAHWILVDNQPPEVGRVWAEEVARLHPGVRFEASGGVTPQTVLAYAWADRVSLGWLTQKAPASDFALDWDPEPASP